MEQIEPHPFNPYSRMPCKTFAMNLEYYETSLSTISHKIESINKLTILDKGLLDLFNEHLI